MLEIKFECSPILGLVLLCYFWSLDGTKSWYFDTNVIKVSEMIYSFSDFERATISSIYTKKGTVVGRKIQIYLAQDGIEY